MRTNNTLFNSLALVLCAITQLFMLFKVNTYDFVNIAIIVAVWGLAFKALYNLDKILKSESN